MKTFVVWVLYISVTTHQTYEVSPAIAVIDNIASQQNCIALSRQVAEATIAQHLQLRCLAVRKVAP